MSEKLTKTPRKRRYRQHGCSVLLGCPDHQMGDLTAGLLTYEYNAKFNLPGNSSGILNQLFDYSYGHSNGIDKYIAPFSLFILSINLRNHRNDKYRTRANIAIYK